MSWHTVRVAAVHRAHHEASSDLLIEVSSFSHSYMSQPKMPSHVRAACTTLYTAKLALNALCAQHVQRSLKRAGSASALSTRDRLTCPPVIGTIVNNANIVNGTATSRSAYQAMLAHQPCGLKLHDASLKCQRSTRACCQRGSNRIVSTAQKEPPNTEPPQSRRDRIGRAITSFRIPARDAAQKVMCGVQAVTRLPTGQQKPY